MKKSKIQIGMRFERLVVMNREGTDNLLKHRNSVWRCLCDCGTIKLVRGHHLLREGTKSCGCFRGESASKRRWRHGQSRSKTYASFNGMVNRCNNPKTINYNNYGGRGITICKRWLGKDGYINFSRDMGERPEGYTLDRINSDGNYEPLNCQWSTFSTQIRNRHKEIFCNKLIYEREKGFSFDLRRE